MKFYNSCLVFFTIFGQTQLVDLITDEVDIQKKNDCVTVVLPFEIQDGFHIQDINDTKDNLIATKITFADEEDFEIAHFKIASLNYDKVILDQIEHRVLSNRLEVVVTIKTSIKHSKSILLKGKFYYQACNDRQCFFPRTLNFEVPIDAF